MWDRRGEQRGFDFMHTDSTGARGREKTKYWQFTVSPYITILLSWKHSWELTRVLLWSIFRWNWINNPLLVWPAEFESLDVSNEHVMWGKITNIFTLHNWCFIFLLKSMRCDGWLLSSVFQIWLCCTMADSSWLSQDTGFDLIMWFDSLQVPCHLSPVSHVTGCIV